MKSLQCLFMLICLNTSVFAQEEKLEYLDVHFYPYAYFDESIVTSPLIRGASLSSPSILLAGVIDSEGWVIKGDFFFVGADLYFQYQDLQGNTQLLKVSSHPGHAWFEDDPASANRRIYLRRDMHLVNAAGDPGGRRNILLPFPAPEGAAHPETLFYQRQVEKIRSAIEALDSYKGHFGLDRDSIQKKNVPPFAPDYFGFDEMYFGGVSQFGGVWSWGFYTGQHRWNVSPLTGRHLVEYQFSVEVLEANKVSLFSNRKTWWRAPILEILNLQIGSLSLEMIARRNLGGIRSTTSAHFCTLPFRKVGWKSWP